MLILYAIDFLIDVLRGMAADTDNTVDDEIVAVLDENSGQIVKAISEKVQ